MSHLASKPTLPFVGRTTELAQLHRTLDSVINIKQPKFILIQGDFGVGKTAFVDHFLAQVADKDPSILIGRGNCSMETELNGLIPFGQVLSSLADQGIQHGMITGDVWEFTKEVAPAWLNIFTLGIASAALKTIEEARKLVRGSNYSQENVFVQFTNALIRLTKKQTTIVFIDDLHWADGSSLSLLFHLARYLTDVTTLFVCTYRPVEALEASPRATQFRDIRANLIRYGAVEMELRRGIDVAEYVEQRYPLNTLSSEIIARIQKMTDGHALFVSQLFTLWEETGALSSALDPGGRRVWNFVHVPETIPTLSQVDEVLRERIRQMAEELRDTLTIAAVEGEDFTAQVIARLRKVDEQQIHKGLGELEDHYRMVEELSIKEVNSTVFDLYRFAHRFFREHIYGDLNRAQRRILHQRVGQALEELYGPDHRLPIAGQLALHFNEAHDFVKAAGYAGLAAEFEQSHFAWAEGERWCELGLDLIQNLPVDARRTGLQVDLLERSGAGYYYSGKFAQADQRFREALTLAQQLPAEAERIADLFRWLGDACDGEGRFEEAVTLYDQGQQVLAKHAIPFGETQIRLEASWGFMPMRFGRHEESVRRLRQVLADADRLPQTITLKHIKARASNWLAVALSNLDNYSESATACKEAIRIANEIHEYQPAVTGLLTLAETYVYEGKLDESEASAAEALKLVRQAGDVDNEAFAYSTRAFMLLARGKSQEAITDLQHAIALSSQLGAMWNMPSMYAGLATAYLALSDLPKAYEYAKRGVEYAEKGHFERGDALDALAQVEAAMHDWDSAQSHFKEAIDFQLQTRDRQVTAQTQRHFAEALLNKGERDKAVDLLRSALTTFQELGLMHETAATQRLLDI